MYKKQKYWAIFWVCYIVLGPSHAILRYIRFHQNYIALHVRIFFAFLAAIYNAVNVDM